MAKRSNGEGSITKRSDGRYSIKWYDVNGQRQSTTVKTLTQAKEKLKEHLADAERGIDTTQGKMPLSEWLDIWLENYAKPVVGPSTFSYYYSSINNHIKPYFGKTLLRELTTHKMQLFYGHLSSKKRLDGIDGTLSPNSIKKIHMMFKMALKQAVNNGIIQTQPSAECETATGAAKGNAGVFAGRAKQGGKGGAGKRKPQRLWRVPVRQYGTSPG